MNNNWRWWLQSAIAFISIGCLVKNNRRNICVKKFFYLIISFFSDVQFHLIGYGGENQWPSHVTVGGKLTFKNKAPKIKFSSEPEDSLRGLEYLPGLYKGYIALFEDILYDLKLAVGQDLRAQTFTEAYFYPFRANALKSIIVANSKPCEVGRFFLVSRKLTKILAIIYK